MVGIGKLHHQPPTCTIKTYPPKCAGGTPLQGTLGTTPCKIRFKSAFNTRCDVLHPTGTPPPPFVDAPPIDPVSPSRVSRVSSGSSGSGGSGGSSGSSGSGGSGSSGSSVVSVSRVSRVSNVSSGSRGSRESRGSRGNRGNSVSRGSSVSRVSRGSRVTRSFLVHRGGCRVGTFVFGVHGVSPCQQCRLQGEAVEGQGLHLKHHIETRSVSID